MNPSSIPPQVASTAGVPRHLRFEFTPTLSILMSGLAYHTYVGGPSGLATSLLGVLYGTLVLVALYLLGEVGVGEIKLMAGVGAWLGVPLCFHLFAAGALISGMYALVLMVDGTIVVEAISRLQSRGLGSPGLPNRWDAWSWILPTREGVDPDQATPPPQGGW